eukprot:334057-Rhodomonas_salina.2
MSSDEWREPTMPEEDGKEYANEEEAALAVPRLGLSEEERGWLETEYGVRMPYPSSDALQWLLGAMPKETFLETIWETKPYIIRHNDPRYLADIMTIDDLHDTLLNATQDRTFAEIVCFKDQEQQPADCPFYAYLSGCSVVLNHADKQSPSVNALCQALAQDFPHAFANMYLTPPNSQAVHPHSDDRDVLLLQIWGSKRWKIYSDPIPLPYTDEQVHLSVHKPQTSNSGLSTVMNLECLNRQHLSSVTHRTPHSDP